MWGRFSWLQRVLYVSGGFLLAYYELHMTWYWFLAGLVSVLASFGLDIQTRRGVESSSD